MRRLSAYSASDEQALRARESLKDWAAEGLLTEAQHQRMAQETVCNLRRTNIFLRLVLFLFTLIIVGAAAGLYYAVFLSHPELQTPGIFLLIVAALCYAAAEIAVSEVRLYRYGIEEALAVCAIGFFSVGMEFAAGNILRTSQEPQGMEWLVPAAGAMASLWIWRRFGLTYIFVAAMVFTAWLTGYWTKSLSAQHLIVVAIYAAGLLALHPRRDVAHSGERDSVEEALLWLGVYLAINIQVSSLNLAGQWWGGPRTAPEFSKPFYWTTWVLCWLLPPVVLRRGLRAKDRQVIAVGAIIAVLTLATNKSYLGWPRHTWDPMLLGVSLAGAALFLRRWLAAGPDGIRHGFTARRLSARDKQWMSAGSVALGLASAHSMTASPQPGPPEVRFGGGDSGGGGASSDF